MYLSRDAILAADDLPNETVCVNEWGGDVIVRGMTGKERDQWEQSLQQRKGKNDEMNLENIRAELLCMVIVDEHGENLFTRKDIEALGKKNAKVLSDLFDVARKMSGLAAEDVEELAKNSEPDQGDISPSG